MKTLRELKCELDGWLNSPRPILSLLVSNASIVRFVPWFVLTLIVVVGVTIESRPQVLAAVHHFVEHVVAF